MDKLEDLRTALASRQKGEAVERVRDFQVTGTELKATEC